MFARAVETVQKNRLEGILLRAGEQSAYRGTVNLLDYCFVIDLLPIRAHPLDPWFPQKTFLQPRIARIYTDIETG